MSTFNNTPQTALLYIDYYQHEELCLFIVTFNAHEFWCVNLDFGYQIALLLVYYRYIFVSVNLMKIFLCNSMS